MNQTPYGRWINTGQGNDLVGYEARKTGEKTYFWPLLPTSIYRVEMNPVHPLTFLHPDGYALRSPLDVFQSDGGTIPRLTQVCIPKDAFLLSFFLHDVACQEHALLRAQAIPGYVWQGMTETAECVGSSRRGDLAVPGIQTRGEGGDSAATATVASAVGRLTGFGDWKKVHLSRLDVDRLLLLMVRAEGGGWVPARTIYHGCRIGVALGIASTWE